MVDKHVVIPDDMGKGLVYNDATKQWQVNAKDANGVKVNPDGSVGLAVSPDEGNEIELRDNGIYLGRVARQTDYYVSNQGDDNAAGTREAPLRTLKRAVERVADEGKPATILLHEGHQFELDGRIFVPDSVNLDLRAYGNAADTTHPDELPTNVYYRGWVARDYPRPIVNVHTVRDDNTFVRGAIVGADYISAIGVHFKVHSQVTEPDDGSLNGAFHGVIDAVSRVTLHGCILEIVNVGVEPAQGNQYRNDVLIRGEEVMIINTLVTPADVSLGNYPMRSFSALVTSNITSKVILIDWVGAYSGTLGNGANIDREPVARMSDMQAAFVLDKGVQVIYDAAHKALFGMTTNWDIFAASGK